MTSLPTLAEFAPLQGERFALFANGAEAVPAELLSARSLGLPACDGREPFSLIFAGPAEPRLPQRIYRLEHPRLPALDLFLVPVAADAVATRYEAVCT
jgi:hypothetical protein